MSRLLVVASPDALRKAGLAVLADVAAARPVVKRCLCCLLWVGVCVVAIFAEEVVQEAVACSTRR